MTKEQLCQLGWLKTEIEDLSYRIRRIENALAGKTLRIDGMSWLGNSRHFSEELAPQLCDLKEKLEEKKRIAVAEYMKIQAFIADIEESYIRLIFTMRYLDGLSWHQVAWRIGGNTADSVRMMHNRYLARLPKEDQ